MSTYFHNYILIDQKKITGRAISSSGFFFLNKLYFASIIFFEENTPNFMSVSIHFLNRNSLKPRSKCFVKFTICVGYQCRLFSPTQQVLRYKNY